MKRRPAESTRVRAIQKATGWSYAHALGWVREYGGVSEDLAESESRTLNNLMLHDRVVLESQGVELKEEMK